MRDDECSCPASVLYEGARAEGPSCSALSACRKGSLRALGLLLRRWPNRAWGGNYEQKVVPMLSEAHTRGGATEPFSVEVLGTLSLPADARPFERWIVTCESRAGSFFLWLDDHLVCEGGNGQPRWNPFRLESVLPFNHDLQHAPQPQRYFLRATFVQQPPNSLTASGGPPSFSMSFVLSDSISRASCKGERAGGRVGVSWVERAQKK